MSLFEVKPVSVACTRPSSRGCIRVPLSSEFSNNLGRFSHEDRRQFLAVESVLPIDPKKIGNLYRSWQIR